MQQSSLIASHPYVDSFVRTHLVQDVLQQFDALIVSQQAVSVAGRVVGKRSFGNLLFLDLQDGSTKIQCGASKKEFCGGTGFKELCKTVQCGDIVGITGPVFTSRTGEKTIKMDCLQLLSKAMRSLPEKFHGLKDVDIRYRQRYLDFIMNPEVRDVLLARSRLVRSIRSFFDEVGFIEVETPVFQASPCGASAAPFSTHHNSLDADFYLRIAPETYLKQLIVGGFEKVFEIGKCFRNEGIDPSHLQEFTMLEWYAAYWNYRDNIAFTQKLLRRVIKETIGTLQVSIGGVEVDFSRDWSEVTFRDLVYRDTGIDVFAFDEPQALAAAIKRKCIDIDSDPAASLGTLIDRLYKRASRPKLIQPTVLLNHPAALLPLARVNDADSRVADSYQVLVAGMEVVKGYSELADPVLQRRLLEEQASHRCAGDQEAMFLDEGFLVALEHGMPPVSGVGIGIDRLTAILTDQPNLKDVVLFPLMK